MDYDLDDHIGNEKSKNIDGTDISIGFSTGRQAPWNDKNILVYVVHHLLEVKMKYLYRLASTYYQISDEKYYI